MRRRKTSTMETPNKERPILGKKIAKEIASASFMVRKVTGRNNVLTTWKSRKVSLIHF